MQDFWLYFWLGVEHIADLRGYDHILFVAALCVRYVINDWKKILILVTAFTVGHSITLFLSTLKFVNVSSAWIEFLIPVTIVITAVGNLVYDPKHRRNRLHYFLASFFGLVHGLGFSNYLKSLLGKDESIIGELLAFNIGLEIGQLVIVSAILLLSLICVTLFNITRLGYIIFVSGAIFGVSLLMAIERIPN